jgi:hypothetical protein
LATDPEVPVRVISPEAAPAWAEIVIGWEDPGLTEKVEGEIVTPWGRLLAVTEIDPAKPLAPVAETVTGKDSPAATLMSAGDALS